MRSHQTLQYSSQFRTQISPLTKKNKKKRKEKRKIHCLVHVQPDIEFILTDIELHFYHLFCFSRLRQRCYSGSKMYNKHRCWQSCSLVLFSFSMAYIILGSRPSLLNRNIPPCLNNQLIHTQHWPRIKESSKRKRKPILIFCILSISSFLFKEKRIPYCQEKYGKLIFLYVVRTEPLSTLGWKDRTLTRCQPMVLV